MADATIDGAYIVLTPGRFGPPNPAYGIPTDGFTGADHHNVAAAAYPVGTVIAAYNSGASKGVAGMSEFVYLKWSDTDTHTGAVNYVAVPASGDVPTTYTMDPDDYFIDTAALTSTLVESAYNPRAVVALSDMTNLYYGWAWCGGVCPSDIVTTMDGDLHTDDSVAVGPITCVNCASDYMGLAGFDISVAMSYAASASLQDGGPMGYAFQAD